MCDDYKVSLQSFFPRCAISAELHTDTHVVPMPWHTYGGGAKRVASFAEMVQPE